MPSSARGGSFTQLLGPLNLPRLNGYQVARRLRAALGRSIFLIAQTAYGQPEDRRLALEAGFDVHLVKPLELEELSFWLAEAAAKVRSRGPVPQHSGTRHEWAHAPEPSRSMPRVPAWAT